MTNWKTFLFLLGLSSIIVSSCDRYKKYSVYPEYISKLADSLAQEQKNGTWWAHKPEKIARHFFPSLSHEGGPKSYEIKSKFVSPTRVKVIVTDKGPLDDEVLSERHTLYLQSLNGIWKIVDLKYEAVRRF